MRSILVKILWMMFFLGAAVTAQEPAAYDELGCRVNELTDSYVCESGPLAGREFVSKAEALDLLQSKQSQAGEGVPLNEALPAPPAKKTTPGVRGGLRLMSWNVKALAKAGSDYDRAALVLGDADIVALQEIDLKHRGRGFLNVIGSLMEEKLGEKICRAWVQRATGGRESYGYLWKDKAVGYVDPDGMIQETCGDAALTVRQPNTMYTGSLATFYSKEYKKMFVLVSVNMERRPDKKDRSIHELFRQIADRQWPVIVAGDLKLNSESPLLLDARKAGFKPTRGFWSKNAGLSHVRPLNFYERFPDVRPQDIKKGLSELFPMTAEFLGSGESGDDISMGMIAKGKKSAKAVKPAWQAQTVKPNPKAKSLEAKPPATKSPEAKISEPVSKPEESIEDEATKSEPNEE